MMILQFACSKSGLVLYNLDPALATTDPEAAKDALAAALEITKANVLISQEAGSDVNYVRICERVIPELRIFDFSLGRGLPMACVLTKMDKLNQKERHRMTENLKKQIPGGEIFQVSNLKQTGISRLQSFIFNSWIQP